MLTNSSSRFNCGSPKISHHLPLSRPSLGVAIFHWPLPAISLKATGAGGVTGCWYCGPILQPDQRREARIEIFPANFQCRVINRRSPPLRREQENRDGAGSSASASANACAAGRNKDKSPAW